MRIIVRSNHENFMKEKLDKKPSTVRELDGNDSITVIDADTGEEFARRITDITVFSGRVIISWTPSYAETKGEKS